MIGETVEAADLPEVSDDDLEEVSDDELEEVSDDDLEVNGEDDSKGDEKDKTMIAVTLPRRDDKNHPFEVFNLDTLTWSQKCTSGKRGDSDVPNMGTGSSLTYHEPTNSLISLWWI